MVFLELLYAALTSTSPDVTPRLPGNRLMWTDVLQNGPCAKIVYRMNFPILPCCVDKRNGPHQPGTEWTL